MKEIKEGDVFGRLTVIREDGTDKHHNRKYICRCICGTEKSILGARLRNGNTRSCGCIRKGERKDRRLPNNKAQVKIVITNYKRHAKERGLDWNLTYEQVDSIIRKPCIYCGEIGSNKIVNKYCKEGFIYNGIDRLNNNIGYINGNVVPCCRNCNASKNNMDIISFVSHVDQIAQNTTFIAKALGIDTRYDIKDIDKRKVLNDIWKLKNEEYIRVKDMEC